MNNAGQELLETIEEQAEIIEKQADRINKLSAILLQQCEVTMAELESITERKDHDQLEIKTEK